MASDLRDGMVAFNIVRICHSSQDLAFLRHAPAFRRTSQ
jgi:hypothetical protein